MRFRHLMLTLAMFGPMMSCRTTDSNLDTLDNAARSKSTTLETNFCGRDYKDKDEESAREVQYNLWLSQVDGMAPLIQVDRTRPDHETLIKEIKQTLNAVNLNVLMAYFYAGGKLIVRGDSAGICRSGLGRNEKYTPEKVFFQFEDSVVLEKRTTDANGYIVPADEGPQSSEVPIHSCWATPVDPNENGAVIYVDPTLVPSKDGRGSDGFEAPSVRHGTVRMFGYILSELIAQAYVEPSMRLPENGTTLEQAQVNGKDALDAKVGDQNLRTTKMSTGFVPSASELQFGEIFVPDPNDPSKQIKKRGIQIPANTAFMEILAGLFNTFADDVNRLRYDNPTEAEKYDLYHYRGWVMREDNADKMRSELGDKFDEKFVLGHAQPRYENILNHFAFAEAFDSYYCNPEVTRPAMEKFSGMRTQFDKVARELDKISVDGKEASLEQDRAYLVASMGGWHGDLYYGVFGENLKMSDGSSHQQGPRLAMFFGRFFGRVFGGFARAAAFVFHGARYLVGPVARFVIRTAGNVAYHVGGAAVRLVDGALTTAGYVVRGAAQGAAYVAGAAVGTIAPGWGRYRSHIGGGTGPLARAFRTGARHFSWHGYGYTGL